MKISNKLTLLTGAALGALSLSYGSAALADEAPKADTKADNTTEVVVTARRRNEVLKDVPIAVTSFSAEKLSRNGAPDITALQQSTPNLTLQVARGSNSTLIAFIRGVGQQDPLWGFEPGVGLYVDDVYIARPQGAVLDIYDVQRIEVLRGPQGTLYGRNTIGGAVKYVTKPLSLTRPDFDIKGTLGNYNARDLTVSGSVPLTSSFAVGAAVASLKHDGWGKNLNTGAQEYNKDVTAYRLSAEFKPNDDFTARLNYDNYADNSNARHGHREVTALNVFGGTLYTGANAAWGLPTASVYDTYAGAGDKNKVTNSGESLNMEYRVNDQITLKSITAARKGHTRGPIDFDGTPANSLDVQAYYDDKQVSQEFQFLYTTPHYTTVAGIYYLNSSAAGAFDTTLGNYSAYAALGPAYSAYANGITALTMGKVNTQSVAIFFDTSIKVNDRLSLSIGGRGTTDKKQGTVYKANYFAAHTQPFGGAPGLLPYALLTNYTNAKTFNKFTPRASLSYAFNADVTGYASISEGFKSGGFDMRGDASKTPDTKNGYNPESVLTSELGLKGALFDHALSFSSDIFSSQYTDVQITRQTPVGANIVSQVENAGKAHMNGAEFEGVLKLGDHLSANATLGYLDGKYDTYNSYNVLTGTITNIAGTVGLQNTPKWTNSFGLNYRNTVAGGIFVITPTASYRSDSTQFETPLPLLDQKAFWLYNLGGSWTAPDGHLKFGIYGSNLSNKKYKIGAYNFPGGAYGNTTTAFYGPPRTVNFQIEYKY